MRRLPEIYRCIFDLPKREAKLEELQLKSEDPKLWDDAERARKLMKELSDMRDEVESWHNLLHHIQELTELAELEDESLRVELETEIGIIEKDIQKRELDTLLSGPYDKGNALLTINSGMGGADSKLTVSALTIHKSAVQ